MKLLYAYTLDYIRRNRRGSLAIMIAILMVSTMLSALCSMLYNIYADNLSYYRLEAGDWHGELFDYSYGKDLTVVEGFDSVEATLLKGPWMVAQIEDPRREYLIFRDADSNYWESMPEGTSAGILEGRIPVASGEIAVSKQYFEHHPTLRLGDSITLPLGNRLRPDGSIIAPQDVRQDGETFAQTGTVTLNLVGKLDVTTSSTVPGYTALGYLDRASITPKSDLTIYMRFKNIHDTYQELPKIAAAVGYVPDEYGAYNVRYNAAYLSRQFVFSPQQLQAMNLLEMGQMPLAFAVMTLLTVGVFVLVIHNAFALSANARLTQLGILASIGATPRQIKRSVILEAALLAVIPLPLGTILGHGAVWFLLERINAINAQIGATYNHSLLFAINGMSVLPAIACSLLTLWWSATIPARRVARLSPIAAIRQGEIAQFKKRRKRSFWARLGLPAELAANAVHARKRSYRTATISLVLSFLTLAVLVCINSANEASQTVYNHLTAYEWEEQDLSVTLENIATPADFSVTKEIEAVPGVEGVLWYNQQPMASWIPAERLSPEFVAAGGFEAASGLLIGIKLPVLRDGSYRLNAIVVGLDDASFAAYCARLGLDPAVFYEEDTRRVILIHRTEDVTLSTRRAPVYIPLLDIQPGDDLLYTEKRWDDFEGDFTFKAEVAAIADEYPPLAERSLAGRCGLVQFMPMSRLSAMSGAFANNRTNRLYGAAQVENIGQIPTVRTSVERICESWFGSGDYTLLDHQDMLNSQQGGQMTVNLIFGFVAGLFAIIGLSNAWATVRGTLTARRQEFAMLRSVGLPPRGLRKMLLYESLVLGVSPILLSLPIAVFLQAVFLSINEVTVAEWLPFAPWMVLLLYTALVLVVICAAYLCGGRQLLKENIIEAMKQGSL